MIIILDWIFEGAAKWIASIVTQLLDGVSGIFLNALGTDMTAMEEYFPFVTSAFNILQYTAWMILLLVTVWQLFRTFGGPITEAENPWHLLARSSIFAFLIGFSKDIFMICLDIARGPYTALWDYTMGPADFTFAGIENVLTSSVVTIVGTISVVGTILIVIMMICIGWNYFKLLLESVERYVLVGVMCYTSPLAFSMGGSKATNKVFQSWCRMVGSQLLLLIMNVWFLRAFSSSVGQFQANAGALSNGQGNIFLWLFCALAMLKVAQKFDNYLSALGLSVAQTGSGMGFEMMMAARVLGGFGGGSKSIGSVFRGGASAGGNAAGTAGMSGGLAGFASKFKGNSYVRDAVVQGGSKMGMGGSVGFVGRAFGGIAARSGAQLSGESISSVASRAPTVSGTIGGDIANRSLGNYMPQLSGKNLSNTEITGGQIRTTATGSDGKEANLQMWSASQFEQPDSPHSIVNASDGSYWYQTATGAGMGEFYSVPEFTGDASEASLAAATFPGLAEGTSLRTVDDGVLEATDMDGNSSLMYNSAFYQEPDAPHDTVKTADGVSWYSMQPHADMPQFDSVEGGTSGITGDAQTVGSSESISAIPGSDGAIYSQGEQSGIPSDGSVVMPADGSESGASVTGDTPFYSQIGQHEIGAMPDGSIAQPGDVVAPSGIVEPGGAIQPGTVVEPGSAPSSMSGDTPFYSQAEQFRQPDSVAADGAIPSTAGTAGAAGAAGYAEPISPVSGGGEYKGGIPQPASADSSFYNQSQFQQFMPGYSENVSSVDASRRDEGMFEVRHANGSGTQFYDKTMYQSPRGDYKVFEDNKGGQWYAIHGNPSVERKPVYENGKAVYENGSLKTVNVETVKYKTTPTKFGEPKKRDTEERKVPKRR